MGIGSLGFFFLRYGGNAMHFFSLALSALRSPVLAQKDAEPLFTVSMKRQARKDDEKKPPDLH